MRAAASGSGSGGGSAWLGAGEEIEQGGRLKSRVAAACSRGIVEIQDLIESCRGDHHLPEANFTRDSPLALACRVLFVERLDRVR